MALEDIVKNNYVKKEKEKIREREKKKTIIKFKTIIIKQMLLKIIE